MSQVRTASHSVFGLPDMLDTVVRPMSRLTSLYLQTYGMDTVLRQHTGEDGHCDLGVMVDDQGDRTGQCPCGSFTSEFQFQDSVVHIAYIQDGPDWTVYFSDTWMLLSRPFGTDVPVPHCCSTPLTCTCRVWAFLSTSGQTGSTRTQRIRRTHGQVPDDIHDT